MMKLQLMIDNCTVNTTFKGLSKVFNDEDTKVFEDMLVVGSALRDGDTISQTVGGINYSIRLIK
jgi:hypothetical protein